MIVQSSIFCWSQTSDSAPFFFLKKIEKIIVVKVTRMRCQSKEIESDGTKKTKRGRQKARPFPTK